MEEIKIIPLQVRCKNNKQKRLILLVVFFSLIAIVQSGLRDINKLPAGNDTPTYAYIYSDVANTSWTTLLKTFTIGEQEYRQRDTGYPLFIKTSQLIYTDFTFFMFLTAIIFFLSFGWIICKYVKSYLGVILVFVIYFAIFTNIVNSFMRQAIVLGITLFAIRFIISRNWKCYFGLMLVALSLHSSAIAAFPFYFLPLVSTSKKWLGLSFFISPILSLFLRSLLLYFLTGSVYDNYVQEDAVNPVNYMLLIVTMALFGYFYLYKLKEVSDDDILTSAIMGTMLILPVVFMGNTMLRISYYYVLVLLLTLPNIIDRIKMPKAVRTTTYLLLISFFIFMIYRQ